MFTRVVARSWKGRCPRRSGLGSFALRTRVNSGAQVEGGRLNVAAVGPKSYCPNSNESVAPWESGVEAEKESERCAARMARRFHDWLGTRSSYWLRPGDSGFQPSCCYESCKEWAPADCQEISAPCFDNRASVIAI